MRIILASILNFVLFIVSYAEIIRFWGKTFFDWTIMGGATIITPSLKTTRNEKNFQDRPNFFLFLSYMTL
jgi:hypothetical protein